MFGTKNEIPYVIINKCNKKKKNTYRILNFNEHNMI